MKAATLLVSLRQRGVTLEAEGDALRVRGTALKRGELEQLREHKQGLLRLLAGEAVPFGPPIGSEPESLDVDLGSACSDRPEDWAELPCPPTADELARYADHLAAELGGREAALPWVSDKAHQAELPWITSEVHTTQAGVRVAYPDPPPFEDNPGRIGPMGPDGQRLAAWWDRVLQDHPTLPLTAIESPEAIAAAERTTRAAKQLTGAHEKRKRPRTFASLEPPKARSPRTAGAIGEQAHACAVAYDRALARRGTRGHLPNTDSNIDPASKTSTKQAMRN